MNFTVLDEREQSHPASTWTEYLCLVTVGYDRFRLDRRIRPLICEYYEWLAEQQDEDAEEINYDIELPDTINGMVVFGVADELILADELPEPMNDDEMSEVFDLDSMAKAERVLQHWEWDGVSLETVVFNMKKMSKPNSN